VRRLPVLLGVLVLSLALASPAVAPTPSVNDLAQLPGAAGCVVDDATALGLTSCADGFAMESARAVAISPDSRSVYTTSFFDHAVTVFDRGPGGALTQKPGPAGCVGQATLVAAACASGPGLVSPIDVAISPDGANAYVVSSNGLAVFDRNPTTGELIQKAGAAGCIADDPTGFYAGCADGVALAGLEAAAISPDGASVYVGGGNSDGVAILDRAPDGTVTQKAGAAGCIVDAPSGSTATCVDGTGLQDITAIAVSPDGTSVYAGSGLSNAGLALFDRDPSGALTQRPDPEDCLSASGGECAISPSVVGALGIVISPDGTTLYVTSAFNGVGNIDAVTAFSRNPSTRSLTRIQCVGSPVTETATCSHDATALDDPAGIAVSPDGAGLYVASTGAGAVLIFDRSPDGLIAERGCASRTGAGGQCVRGAALAGATDVGVTPDGDSLVASAVFASGLAVFARGGPACDDLQRTVPGAARAIDLSCADPDGDQLTIEILDPPDHGTLGPVDQTVDAVAYTPAAGFVGLDSLTYRAVTPFGASAPATVGLDVLPAVAGPPGPIGPVGPRGPAGPRGAAPAPRLVIGLADQSPEARAGSRVAFRYVATAPGRATLVIRRGSRVVVRLTGTARAGRNTLTWNGRIARRPAGPGRYRVTLSVLTSRAQRDSDTAVLTLAPVRPAAPPAAP
jgi:DNA-binding beta-propeller fold protein YncE